jgi:hypothetical protein
MSTFEDWVRMLMGEAKRQHGPDLSGMRGMSPEEIAAEHRKVAEAFASPGDLFSDWMNQPQPGQPTQARPYDEGDWRRDGPLTDPRVIATMRFEFARQRLREMGGVDAD